MNDSTSYKATLSEQLVNIEKLMNLAEAKANGIKAAISTHHSARDNASGNRYAMMDKTFKEANEEYINLKYDYGLLMTRISFLKDVAYQSFTVWNNANNISATKVK